VLYKLPTVISEVKSEVHYRSSSNSIPVGKKFGGISVSQEKILILVTTTVEDFSLSDTRC
jgi:hypothetical protein